MQRRGRQGDAMGLTDALDIRNPCQDMRRRVLIIVFGALNRAGCQNARIEHAAEQYADALLLRQRQELLKRRLLQQGIASGEQHGVERSGLRETHAHLSLVHADPDARDHALAAKPVERHIGPSHRFAKTVLDRIGAMGPDIDVVNQQKIDPVGAEPQQ